MYRAHRLGVRPLHVYSRLDGIYDLPAPSTTTYAALDLATAMNELMAPAAGTSRTITAREAEKLVVTAMKIRRPFRLASISHAKARAFTLDGHPLSETDTLERRRAWAERLSESGFDGVVFSSRLRGSTHIVALFEKFNGSATKPPAVIHGVPTPGIEAALMSGFSVDAKHARSQIDLI
ncbi:RES family NAD+ phosphorylase [Glaciihabitans sp. INWT7]|uniref:RES family NAD+ phosphorylase n=1 Tax=Glaciihabitans sp. INWT7 TaxID=2596912 RepID=UPI0016240357|nr:RES family NAD+ phosphorylase [Glaciihabitans sp. INWT7]